MLERLKENHPEVSSDDIMKTMKKTVDKLKKNTSKEEKLDALSDIIELSKVMIDVVGITNDEYFEHLNARRAEIGTFTKETEV